ncbi:hypothetical protein [Nocardia cyriacigeorgica]|uniref:hypothetical protein n=1 Tax=Nocardia cyriacigeorgica TaxID=135487 RepID=UPI0024560BD6|nr:hypothetical protein [Nocardia cyriacigeorgica]
MFRRLTLIGALAACSVACQDEVPPVAAPTSTPAAASAQFWSTVPQTDDQRWEVLRRIRAIDPCALLPREVLSTHAAVRTVTSDGPLPTGCRAVLESGGPEPIEIEWAAQKGPLRGGFTETRRLGDIAVNVDPPEPSTSSVPATCRFTAQFPAEVIVFFSVEAAAPADPCAIGDPLLDTVLTRWRTEPPHGTSPDTATTVLTGADPCAVLPALSVAPEPAGDQLVQMCEFRHDGEEMVISYNYDGTATLDEDEKTELDGRSVYRSQHQDFHIYSAAVGERIAEGESYEGDIVPVVSVTGKDEDMVERTMRELLARFT